MVNREFYNLNQQILLPKPEMQTNAGDFQVRTPHANDVHIGFVPYMIKFDVSSATVRRDIEELAAA